MYCLRDLKKTFCIGAPVAATMLTTAAVVAEPVITEFEHTAGVWLAVADGEVLYAFDEFRPGLAAGSGCLAGTPGTTWYLADGVVTLSKLGANNVPGCVLNDTDVAAVSDGWLPGPPGDTRFIMDFSPPVSAFFTYYGSLEVGETVTMHLYSDDAMVGQLESAQSLDAVDAAGHGFISDTLIDRIEFTSSDGGGVVIGAFNGLLVGEGSLGTIEIAGYQGPNGTTVELDFGLVFAPDCDNNGIDDATDISQGASDSNGNGVLDECEVSGIISGATVWASGRTLHIGSNLSIESGSLTIEAGVDVVPANGVEIDVMSTGHLQIDGTEAQPVRIRPLGTDRWDGIRFLGGSGDMNHAILERLTTQAIDIQSASPSIDSCVIRDVAPASGSAYGIRVVSTSNPAISNTVIQSVRGSFGGATGNGSSGGNGGGGANGSGDCDSGNNGNGGGAGGSPAAGGAGGNAYGVFVGSGAAVRLVSSRISDLQGANGGDGGNGGNGGNGHSGGNGAGGFLCGGNGGNGGNGGSGGHGADGGRGGHAMGVRFESALASFVAQNIITHLVAGDGADGGNGGNGGSGGAGGNGAGNLFSPGDGGDGGNAGNGGRAGDGGDAGLAQAVSILNHTEPIVVSQNTMGSNLTRGGQGLRGSRGSRGSAGSAGSGSPDGSSGSSGSHGAVGSHGLVGNAIGIFAVAGPSPVITASNNIIVPGNPSYSVGMQADSNAVIIGDNNCFNDFNLLISGGVSPGANTIVADPQFADADGMDDLPGTEDDNRRLLTGSPAIDAGGNAEIPGDVTDLDGDANTAELLPLDADGNPRIVDALVDIGAYESGTASLPCPWDLDGSGDVGINDFLDVLAQWGTDPGGPPDFDGSGDVGINDFLALLANWGPCP